MSVARGVSVTAIGFAFGFYEILENIVDEVGIEQALPELRGTFADWLPSPDQDRKRVRSRIVMPHATSSLQRGARLPRSLKRRKPTRRRQWKPNCVRRSARGSGDMKIRAGQPPNFTPSKLDS
jgi:hypothetical protein